MMISHFLLNLQDISNMTTYSSGTSRSEQNQVSSIQFVNNIIGSLGGSLRDRSHQDDQDDGIEIPNDLEVGAPLDDDEKQSVHALPASDRVLKENITGPSRIATRNASYTAGSGMPL